ncbi:tRNA pseudouridine(38-40) synthase TruA [Hyphomicrobium sp. CS1BSMeth3]|uniref:tRNA pseudouridine(38-40) synthase TruA n=1 Tax=Hyphomicrobium sp. CS1BSMeth3 TaxID=1892844 RepID=UPI0009312FD5|nr:tRNA pseudouridine(38-40) synthase TruA [Hyphomicrobium sp. CS1BSMeth3]
MPRYRITIEYDGTPFLGWQIQADGKSVQGSLVEAIHKLGGETVEVRGAGRTDAGVHALGQVAHFDLVKEWPADTVRDAVNFHLKPAPITILDCVVIGEGFDARFSAVARHYLYRILARRAPPALDRDRVWWVPRPLDASAMAAAAPALLGRHDFTTFRAASCQARSAVKTLDRLDVTAVGDEIRIEASARSFLHHQVRSIVGSLKHVGEGKWPVSEMAAALAAADRSRCGALAPSSGLYLVRVDYPPGPFPPRSPK